jgi:hypothetical protein
MKFVSGITLRLLLVDESRVKCVNLYLDLRNLQFKIRFLVLQIILTFLMITIINQTLFSMMLSKMGGSRVKFLTQMISPSNLNPMLEPIFTVLT